MKYPIAITFLLLVVLLVPLKESIAGTDPYLGEITIFAGKYAPSGYAFCDGELLPIASYPALYNILGTTYGGDGRTNFALPNLAEAEKSLKGAKYIISINGQYPPRN